MISDLGLIDAPLRPYAKTTETMEVQNPATGEVIGAIEKMSAQDVEASIGRAEAEFSRWRMKSAHERATILKKWAALMLERRDEIARVVTLEQGKPLREARGEVDYAAAFIEWFAEESRRTYGDTIPGHKANIRLSTIRQPIGVVAAITPWNFPLAMITRKAGAALAAGCTIVVKPAEQTPYSAFAIQKLAVEAGVPEDALILVTGDPSEIGEVLTRDARIRKLSFTGSTKVGSLLYRQSADTVKKLSLELGGNAPFIVFDDADLDRAVDAALASKFRNAGQTCVCADRFYVQDTVYDAFALTFAKRVSELKVGNGLEETTDVGPLINSAALKSVKESVDAALEHGAQAIIGGASSSAGELFYEPTVLTEVPQDSPLVRDENFGPIAALVRFSDEADLLQKANDSDYGLAGYLFTRDLEQAIRVSEQLECGMVGINSGMVSTEVAPFGGIKQSGLGREGGWQGLDDYMETKLLVTELSPPTAD